MALKGKKKSRARGSQARRRPAAAPRPTYGGRDKPRWYQTTQGLVIAFVVAAAVTIVTWWWVADSRSDARLLEQQRETVQTYTTNIRTLVQTITPVASEISGAASLGDAELVKAAAAWKKQLGEAQTTVTQLAPPEGLDALNGLVTQSLLLYVQSAEQYELLPELEGNAQQQVSAKALASFQAADNVFANVVQLIDKERQELELAASGITTPASAAAASAPTPGAPGTEGSAPVELPSEPDGGEDHAEEEGEDHSEDGEKGNGG